MDALAADAVLRLRSDVRFRVVQGEAVVLRQKAGEILVLNGTGTRALALVDGTRTLGEIAAAVAATVEADPEEVRRDVLGFAAELVEAGVVEAIPA